MVNKYALYVYVLLAAFLVTMGPTLVHLQTYKSTIGRVFGFKERLVYGKYNSYYKRFPRVNYTVNNEAYSIYGPSYMEEASRNMDSVTVFYNASNPAEGIIYNYYGVWGRALTFLIPFFLIWTICIFSVDFIPKRVNLRQLLNQFRIR